MDTNTHETEPEKIVLNNREPMNDVMEHFNTVNGFAQINNLEQIPKKLRKPIQIYNIILILAVVIGIIWSFIH